MDKEKVDNSLLVSILVLNWNGKRFVEPFFSSLEKIKIPDGYKLEKIFIDNNSTDGSVEYLEAHYKDVRIVKNNKNYGYAKGNNLGIKHAGGDFILVTNNDVKFDREWLCNLIEAANTYKEYDVFSPKLVYASKPETINNAGSTLVPNSDWPIVEIGANEPSNNYDEVRDITAFCGANVLFRREFLESVGMFDNQFFMYFEDGDLSWRGQNDKRKYLFIPSSVVYHEHTGTSKEGSPLFNHYVSRNRVLILAKNAHFLVFFKGFAKVIRDHVYYKMKRLLDSVKKRSGTRHSLVELWRGLKIVFDACRLLPLMFLKRYGIVPEAKL